MADFTIRSPLVHDDLPGLSDRVCALLRAAGPEIARCDVTGVGVDAVVVEGLARLQLAAGRLGCRIRFEGASPELRELVALMGLDDVFAG